MEDTIVTRICPCCKNQVKINTKDLVKIDVKQKYPFLEMIHVYEVKFADCPKCESTFEFSRFLKEIIKNGRPVHSPIH